MRLIRQLPQEAATWYSVHGSDAAWTIEAQLLAGVADRIDAGNWQRGGGKGSKPKPIPRPGVGRKKQTAGDASALTQNQVRALLRARGPQPEEGDDGS